MNKIKIISIIMACIFMIGTVQLNIMPVSAASLTASQRTGWMWPAETGKIMTSLYGMRTDPSTKFHSGIDIGGSGNILAAKEGVVSYTGSVGTYGNVVAISHDNGAYYSFYAHLASYSVSVGEKVPQGRRIGIMGKTGGDYGVHLHFQVQTTGSIAGVANGATIAPTSAVNTNPNGTFSQITKDNAPQYFSTGTNSGTIKVAKTTGMTVYNLKLPDTAGLTYNGYTTPSDGTAIPKPTSPVLLISSTNLTVGQNATFTFSAFDATSFTVDIWRVVNGVNTVVEIKSGLQFNGYGTYTRSFSTAGSYYAFVTAFNSSGKAVTNQIKFTVKPNPAPTSPVLLVSNKNPTVGQNVTFTFSAFDATSFALDIWRVVNGVYTKLETKTVNIHDQGTYTRSFSTSGNHYAFVTASNSAGSVTSSQVNFTVHPSSYTITYNANGGSSPPASQTKTHGVALTLRTAIPTRTGYTFLGWSASSTATSATYSAGASFTTNANTTLYAVWKPITYTITYNANGGSGAPANQTKTHDKALTLSTAIPTRTGYTFLGWATSSTATTATYSAGASFTSNAKTTLYAVWKKENDTIFTKTTVTQSVNVGNYHFSVDIANAVHGSRIVAVTYDNTGRMKQTQILPILGEIENLSFNMRNDLGATYAKVMIWDNMSNMNPLCEAEIIPLL